jgi:glycosyltransferase involved in cell wall biosynthesis
LKKRTAVFFVDPEKPEELAEKLIELCENKELLRQWGKNSRRLSIEIFDKNILSEKVAVVLEEVAGRP